MRAADQRHGAESQASLSNEASCRRWENGRLREATTSVVREARVRLHVNGVEWLSLMATPRELDLLALGFLASEGIIRHPEEVRRIVVCPSGTCVEVWLQDAHVARPAQETVTSGCGGGITFADLSAEQPPMRADARMTARQLGRLMFQLQERERTRGLHTAALGDDNGLIALAEDVGRHNTLDKLFGRCLVEGIATEGRVLLTTGRISAEMLNKAMRMRTPIVASRSSPTTLSVALAEAWNVTVVGYVRRDSLTVYTGVTRVLDDAEEVGINAQS
jgi:FdhD protein